MNSWGPSRQRGLGLPWYPCSEWERTVKTLESSGADVAHSASHHLATFPGTLPPLLAPLPLPLISSLSPGPVCSAVGGTCQPHWARALWTPAKAPRGVERGPLASRRTLMCCNWITEVSLQRFYCCLIQGAEKLLRWPFFGEICLGSFFKHCLALCICVPEV